MIILLVIDYRTTRLFFSSIAARFYHYEDGIFKNVIHEDSSFE